eukprot:6199523-Pleurochrysis_carterae.AAC.1
MSATGKQGLLTNGGYFKATSIPCARVCACAPIRIGTQGCAPDGACGTSYCFDRHVGLGNERVLHAT